MQAPRPQKGVKWERSILHSGSDAQAFTLKKTPSPLRKNTALSVSVFAIMRELASETLHTLL